MVHARRLACWLTCLVLLSIAAPVSAADFMFSGTVDGQTFEGRPLSWNDNIMYLEGRDGRLWEFNPRKVENAKKTSLQFEGYTVPEMKRELYKEFGDALDITTTQHYIVVHPRGEGGEWAHRFEELYRSFLAYFRVRGFQVEEPQFPLVAIVYQNRDAYFRAASASGTKLSPGTLGHYDYVTNRVQLFDITNGDNNADWSENASTIIHEATHQTAFNTGIQNRFGSPPVWTVEGLATMFEAPGVWNSQSFHTLKDRINKGRLDYFRENLKNRKPGTFGNLIASDQLFKTDSAAAYSEAWAMTLFLCETRPREMAQYYQKLYQRPDFSSYFATERVHDFAECFGSDFKQLEANFLNWMAEVP